MRQVFDLVRARRALPGRLFRRSMWRAPFAWLATLGPGKTIVHHPLRSTARAISKQTVSIPPSFPNAACRRRPGCERPKQMTDATFSDDPLVSTEWLAEPTSTIPDVDGDRRDLVHAGPGWRRTRQSTPRRHIPGAVYSSTSTRSRIIPATLPHMLPEPADFAVHARAAPGRGGPIRKWWSMTARACSPSPRVWWMFRAMGHPDVVKVLDGGLPQWIAEAHPLEKPVGRSGLTVSSRRTYDARSGPQTSITILTATLDRWPRPGARRALAPTVSRGDEAGAPSRVCAAGHMPGALNLPSQAAWFPDDGRLKSIDELAWKRHSIGGRCRSRQTHRHHLRLRRFGGDPGAGAGPARALATRRSTTGPGANGARAPTSR